MILQQEFMDNNMFEEMCQKYKYVYKNNVLAFLTGPLSNWFGAFTDQSSPIKREVPINEFEWESFTFNCTEQIFMAEKAVVFDDWETLNEILKEKHPRKQKEWGRAVKGFDPLRWDRYKYAAMLEANREKYKQNPHLKEFLLSTPKHSILCEVNPRDSVWGIGLAADDERAYDVRTWQGENLLGQVLMEVRSEL